MHILIARCDTADKSVWQRQAREVEHSKVCALKIISQSV